MECKKIEKWLSDSMDGALKEKKKKKLTVHLEKCNSCRSYARSLEKIQKEIEILEKAGPTPEYWKQFNEKLMRGLRSLNPQKRMIPSFFSSWKWVWGGAALVLFIALGLTIFFLQPKRTSEIPIFSFEDSLDEIYLEIGNNHELESLFNSLVLSSLEEILEESHRGLNSDFYEDPLLWESLSEEELEFLESEIKKEMKT